MKSYKILQNQCFQEGEFKLVPIRHQDRYDIMRWRNEQMYHLRQSQPLTEAKQDRYFDEVVSQLFDQERPDQILFSFLQNKECIGYGGLVHINWEDRNAELSFIMNTKLEATSFASIWTTYLSLIEEVAFVELKLHKIYTYAFDLRPHLYQALENNRFFQDGRLKQHCRYQGRFLDVVIHGKLNQRI